MRYQHPPVETLYQLIDQVIHKRMVEIRQAYRDAAGGRGEMPPFEALWDMATGDVRRALDEVDPPVDTVHVPLLGPTRDEQPTRTPGGVYLAPWHPGIIEGDTAEEQYANAHERFEHDQA